MIKAMLIGDSVLYGAQGAGRLAIPPRQTLNTAQAVYDFCYDHSMPGASFALLLSDDPAERALAGLPGGIALADLLAATDAGAVLINLGGNDSADPEVMPANVKRVASICKLAGKAFGFVGVIDVNVASSYAYEPLGTSFWDSGYLARVSGIAAVAELLRQTCAYQDYPYVDVRNGVTISDWDGVTGDIVHPSQAYSIQIFTHVAHIIAGT
ncbi:hypothetical protein [Acidovorax sp.]|uniref:hypothetical protein n=1 Tax=Acidovorax sp. TaxID=1872122 RepID=UPI003D07ECF2